VRSLATASAPGNKFIDHRVQAMKEQATAPNAVFTMNPLTVAESPEAQVDVDGNYLWQRDFTSQRERYGARLRASPS
jgi:hypothetical protein